MKNENAPCKGCTERQSGCHSCCEKYRKFKQDIEDLRKKEKQEHDVDAVARYQKKAIAMMYKAKGKNRQ